MQKRGLANAEILWVGIRTERKLDNQEAVLQRAQQLRNRFSQSDHDGAYEKGLFNEGATSAVVRLAR